MGDSMREVAKLVAEAEKTVTHRAHPVVMSAANWERVVRYSKAHRIPAQALIEAAVTLCVPEEAGGTATPEVLELERRARLLAKLGSER
jgi:hypothetical protein